MKPDISLRYIVHKQQHGRSLNLLSSSDAIGLPREQPFAHLCISYILNLARPFQTHGDMAVLTSREASAPVSAPKCYNIWHHRVTAAQL